MGWGESCPGMESSPFVILSKSRGSHHEGSQLTLSLQWGSGRDNIARLENESSVSTPWTHGYGRTPGEHWKATRFTFASRRANQGPCHSAGPQEMVAPQLTSPAPLVSAPAPQRLKHRLVHEHLSSSEKPSFSGKREAAKSQVGSAEQPTTLGHLRK